jgi:aspartyl-tRNA(Asn)/glutamyl-tRNA(Gln) amidotransferase subunit A
MELGSRWTAADLAEAAFVRSEVFRAMQALFANHDFLVTPTLSAAAMAIDQDAFDSVIIAGEDVGSVRGAWYPYTYPFNLTGHPALSVPCGVSSEGLPIGLQIVGPWYAERRILTLAKFVELAGNWLGRRPPV